uniref:Uncharacterized protein n=1 Tax=Uncultured archaeon GZfos26G2 TaxID=3386331 RepID=Q648G7_UNCAG|nr:hypothetical protein GZ37D1_57 [uncultured archaeon GZfos37D1]
MVKVTKGALGGERPTGYPLYTTNYGVGPGVGVRRQIPTTALPTVGTSLAQKRQKECFAAAAKTYKKYNVLEKDFYKRYWLIDTKIDEQGTTAKRILTGRQLAIKEIARTVCTSGEKCPKPLGFCICAVDTAGNPAPEHELNITSEKLGNFEYKELNDEYACFPPSSLSPKHEPYHLFYTDAADYCLLSAERIHKIKTLPLVKKTQVYHRGPTKIPTGRSTQGYIVWDFSAMHISAEEIEIKYKIEIGWCCKYIAIYRTLIKNGVELEGKWILCAPGTVVEWETTVNDGDITYLYYYSLIVAVYDGAMWVTADIINNPCP